MPKHRKRSVSGRTKRKKLAKGTPSRAHIEVTARDRAAGKWFAKLVALQARLRGPDGCPWDREQTHESLRRFLIEEAYEVLDAMDSSDPKKFASELGDLLLQVVFHAILAEETGAFTISDVIEAVHAKMVRRHPHVFGEEEAKTSDAVLKKWEQLKAEERAGEGEPVRESVLSGVPHALPGVLEAYQLTRRASHVGFDWGNLAAVLDKLEEEKRELESISKMKNKERGPGVEEEVGDLLFTAVNVARFLGADPEIALKKANRKFKKRFDWMEAAAAREGRRFADLPRERMEELWNESKAAGPR